MKSTGLFKITTGIVTAKRLLSDRDATTTDLEHQLMISNAGHVVTHGLLAQNLAQNLRSSEIAFIQSARQHEENTRYHEEQIDVLSEMRTAQENLGTEVLEAFKLIADTQSETNDVLNDLYVLAENSQNMVAKGFHLQLQQLELIKKINNEASEKIDELISLQKNKARVQGLEYRDMALQLFSTAAKVEEARAITLYQEIEQLLQRAIDANPTDFIAFFNLGWIKKNIYGDLGNAAAYFEKASLLSFELEPRYSVYCHNHLCLALLAQRKYDETLVVCSDATSISSGNEDMDSFKFHEAKALIGKGEFTKGLKILGTLVKGSTKAYLDLLQDRELCVEPRVQTLVSKTASHYRQKNIRVVEAKAKAASKKLDKVAQDIEKIKKETRDFLDKAAAVQEIIDVLPDETTKTKSSNTRKKAK